MTKPLTDYLAGASEKPSDTIAVAKKFYSNSKLSTYETCPLKFKFAYVDKVKVEAGEKIEFFLGSRVHEALEKLYADVRMGHVDTLDDVLGFFREGWKKAWNDDVEIMKADYTADDYLKRGENMLREYYARHHPFEHGKILGLEDKITVRLDGLKGYFIIGYIDRLVALQGGVYEIHDYKTSSYLPMQEDLDSDRQLALYSLAVMERFPDAKKVDLVWHYLAFDRELRSTRTRKQLDELCLEVSQLISQIERAIVAGNFPANESKLCSWCDFEQICPKRAHLFATEKLPANKYLSEPGVKLVNQLVKLKDEKRDFIEKIEREIENVEEALFVFSLKEKVDVVAGSGFKARIKVEEKQKFPGKSEDGREQLEDLLRKEGKWDEISTLDLFALAKAMNEWDPHLREKIAKFAKNEKRRQIFLSRLDSGENGG